MREAFIDAIQRRSEETICLLTLWVAKSPATKQPGQGTCATFASERFAAERLMTSETRRGERRKSKLLQHSRTSLFTACDRLATLPLYGVPYGE